MTKEKFEELNGRLIKIGNDLEEIHKELKENLLWYTLRLK